MHRIAWFAIVCALLTACSSGKQCTAIGTQVGVGVQIKGPLAARASSASMEVCWDGGCEEARVELQPTRRTVTETCAGDTCSATSVPDGGKHAFGDVPGLPERPVRVRLALLDAGGEPVLERAIDVTPRLRYPNGPDCGGGGPNAALTVEGDGVVREG